MTCCESLRCSYCFPLCAARNAILMNPTCGSTTLSLARSTPPNHYALSHLRTRWAVSMPVRCKTCDHDRNYNRQPPEWRARELGGSTVKGAIGIWDEHRLIPQSWFATFLYEGPPDEQVRWTTVLLPSTDQAPGRTAPGLTAKCLMRRGILDTGWRRSLS